MSDEIELRVAWQDVASRAVASADSDTAHSANALFDDVVGRHRQPHRRYHGLRHVVWVVRHARQLAAALEYDDSEGVDLPAAMAAAFFHDAVYDPRRDDNEELSAVLATERLAAIGWSASDCDVVACCVRATATHLADPDLSGCTPLTTAVVLDADLAVLGADPNAYQAYATGVRAEYGLLDDAAWRRGRAEVLRRLLDRDPLYLTSPAQQWWDGHARANLTAELATL